MDEARAPGTTPAAGDWRPRFAFGWPSGSVRAVLALVVASTTWGALVLRPDREVPAHLRDLLFIILGHYFAVRGRAGAEAPGGPPPLWLPKGTIRLTLIGGFVAVAALLRSRGQLVPVDRHPGSITLLLVGGFLLGALVRLVASRWPSGARRRWPRLLEDAKAALALLAALVLALLSWDQIAPFLPASLSGEIPRLGSHGPEHLAAAAVGFYFGSR